MSNLYRFSPIENEKQLDDALNYIVVELDKLSNEIFHKSLPITTLKIFPHYLEEYNYLFNLISKKGSKASFSSDTSLYVEVDEKIDEYDIKYLGVRIVDPYRLQVGCGDYEIDNFNEFKEKYSETSQFIRNAQDDMLEIWHPDFDILGYVVPKISK